MRLLFLLLIIYQLKHFIADYPLQGEYMLGKFKPDWSFLKPLLAHVGIHATFTFFIAIWLVSWPIAILLAFTDAFIHFIMDRLKAGAKYLGRYKPLTGPEYMANKAILNTPLDATNVYAANIGGYPIKLGKVEDYSQGSIVAAKDKLRGNKLFWWSLGLDQMVHHLTHYGIIYLIILFH